jgi:hypothetical protein
VRSSWYVYSLTFEKDTATRFQKLRVMVIEEKFLTSISEFTGHPKFEHPFHYIRWNTLKQMSELYIKVRLSLFSWLLSLALSLSLSPVSLVFFSFTRAHLFISFPHFSKEKAMGRLQNFRLVELVVPDETAEARTTSPHPLSPSASSHLDSSASASNSSSPTVTSSY